MRACIVSETYPPDVNGCALTVGKFAEGLVADGHQVQLVRVRNGLHDRPRRRGGLREYPQQGMPIPCYKIQQFGLPAEGQLLSIWKEREPQVVYIATEGPLGLSALHAAVRRRLPVITGFHTNFHTYSKHYRLGPLFGIASAYLRAFHNASDCTIVPSPDLRRKLERAGYHNVRVVGRGVDTDFLNPRKRSAELRRQWGAEEGTLVVLYVGRIAPEKNLAFAVRAFHAMARRAVDARFILVGDGPMRPEMQATCPEFVFRGMRTGEDLAAHYASADVFVFPSMTETFGNVTTEAMASGLAVVAYDYAGARMHITDGQTGALAPFGDETAFVQRAAELAGDLDRVRGIGRNARLVAEGITWERIARDFQGVLHDTVEAKR